MGIRTPVVNEMGIVQGELFPDKINTLSAKQSYAIFRRINIGAEHYGFRRADLMKANLWPEPENITLVTEKIVWDVFENKYKYFYINYVPRFYHTEVDDSYIRRKTHGLQALKNKHWNACYILNRPHIYKDSQKNRLVMNLQVCCFARIIKKNGEIPPGEKITRFQDKLLQLLLYIPGIFAAYIYKRKKME